MSKNSHLKGKSVLITGGTGSFGRVLAKKLLEDGVERVVIYSRDEWKQWEMRRSHPTFDSPGIEYFLGDVRDRERLKHALHGIDCFVHAAALKQVPVAERNPQEAIKTNILGAINVIEASMECGVEKGIALSTDKAVNPVNLYGGTKLCSDKLFVAGGGYAGQSSSTQFAVVRYGNVLASRGSIIPLWRQMIQSGAHELPVTDERMTRFWITLNQAVDFVISSLDHMQGGEIFVPKIPSMKIIDLAQALGGENIPIKVIGIREGEKLHELLINEEDSRHTLELEDRYVIFPEVETYGHPSSKEFFKKRNGQPLPEGFTFSSENNTQWLGVDELRVLLGTQFDSRFVPTS